MTGSPSKRDRVKTREQVAAIAAEARAQAQRVVLTNGCFDLLHVGHLRYLEGARALGDLLIVGVNSDASVRRLKGAARPLNPAAERAELVAGLRSVDYVTVFEEDTAADLAHILKPDVYVKGGDYSSDVTSPRFPLEGKVVLAAGGAVCILPMEPGHSTTALLARLDRT